MGQKIDRLEILQRLLRAAPQVTVVRDRVFPEGQVMRDEVIVTHRFLILREGRMDYTVDGVTRRLESGEQFFVPAWCRRTWRAPAGSGGCRLAWCEFASGAVPAGLFWREMRDPRRETEAFGEMLQLAESAGREAVLRLEGELKAALARFWTEADMGAGDGRSEVAAHPEVAKALAWLDAHYAEPDALEAFYREVALSPNHFRLLFRRQTGETVQARLARLRLRRARYLVRETTLPMKRIAAESGFSDPLYFSGQYRKFWGRAATEDRSGSGMA